MEGYVKDPHCRICTKISQEDRDAIDSAILNRAPLEALVEKYKHIFPSEAPLTIYALQNHKKHLTEYASTVRLSVLAKEVESGSLTVVPSKLVTGDRLTSLMADTVDNVSRGIIVEEDILLCLISDNFKDLQYLAEFQQSSPPSIKYLRAIVMAKDALRKTLFDALQKNRELQQKEGGEIDKAMAVKEALTKLINLCAKALATIKVSQETVDQFKTVLISMIKADPILSRYSE